MGETRRPRPYEQAPNGQFGRSLVNEGKEEKEMRFSRAMPTMFCLALLGATFSPSAKADAWDKKTEITFSRPVQIPAVHQPGWGVLPPGTYVFKVVESGSN